MLGNDGVPWGSTRWGRHGVGWGSLQGTLWHGAMLCSAVLCSAVQSCTEQCSAMRCHCCHSPNATWVRVLCHPHAPSPASQKRSRGASGPCGGPAAFPVVGGSSSAVGTAPTRGGALGWPCRARPATATCVGVSAAPCQWHRWHRVWGPRASIWGTGWMEEQGVARCVQGDMG